MCSGQPCDVIHIRGRVQGDGLHRQDRAVSEQEVRYFAQTVSLKPLNLSHLSNLE